MPMEGTAVLTEPELPLSRGGFEPPTCSVMLSDKVEQHIIKQSSIILCGLYLKPSSWAQDLSVLTSFALVRSIFIIAKG